MNSSMKESEAMREVRAWKEVCAREVAGLDIRVAVRKRLRDSAETARHMGFVLTETDRQPHRVVAEPKANNGKDVS